MHSITQIILVENDLRAKELIQERLERAGIHSQINHAHCISDFENALAYPNLDLIISEVVFPNFSGIEVLKLSQKLRPEIPVVFITEASNEKAAADSLAQGAIDYVLKPLLFRLESAVKRALYESRREILEKRRFSEEQECRTLLENTPDFIVRYDNKLQRTYVNPAWEKASGLSARDVIGVDVDKISKVKNPVNTSYLGKLRQTLETGCTQTIEFTWENVFGEKLFLDYIIVPEFDCHGTIVGVVAIGRDLSSRKRAEEQVALLNFALNITHEAVFLIDDKSKILYSNQEASRMLGYSPVEFQSMAIPQINPLLAIEQWPEHWSDLKKHGSITFEGALKAKDGKTIPVEINANYFEYEEKCFDLGLVRDISSRKKAEEEQLGLLNYFSNMDKINRSIQKSCNLEQLLMNLLNSVLEIFDCDRAFLLYPCDPNSKSWFVPMECSRKEYPGVLESGLEMATDPQTAEVFRILLSNEGPVTFGEGNTHPLPEIASASFGLKSFMSIAVYPQNDQPWDFGVHQCNRNRIWTNEELRLFRAIAQRMTDSLSTMLVHRELQASLKRLEEAQRIAHIGNWEFNGKDNSLFWSNEIFQIFELDSINFKPTFEGFLGFVHPDDKAKVDSAFRQSIKTSGHYSVEHRIICPGGKVKFVCEQGETRLINDHTVCSHGTLQDITDRKAAEESIEKLSQAIEQSPISIVISDVQGKVEFVNKHFTELTGYTAEEIIGRKLSILKSGQNPPEVYKQLWETITSGEIWQGEFCNRKKSGELFLERATIAPVRNVDKVITHFVGVKEDITEQRKMEERLLQSQKLESVGLLAGGVAHDFNNMLSIIMAHSELGLKKAEKTNPLVNHLQEILGAADRSANLTRQLLTFARKQPITPKVIDLNETIENLLKLLRRLIGENINLIWAPEKPLWGVFMDPTQVDQIVINLCVNARDAIKETGHISIKTCNNLLDEKYCKSNPGAVPGEYVMLSISDNGAGMSKSTLDRIFEPFFTTKPRGKGTGLGLATVYGIVNQNNGFLSVYSEVGHGTTFKIFLARHIVAGDLEFSEKNDYLEDTGNETILLVEDEPAILEVTKAILEEFGYTVFVAQTPVQAIEIAQEHRDEIHFLITDVVMPEMTGKELKKNLDSFLPNLKCLFMSGYTDDIIAHHGILDHGVNFIQKPFSHKTLLKRIREILQG
ncbi:MAG: PAS domain S-box protein [Candidatus Riflebacteria bacterium]